jgi:acyl carrier protein
VKTKNQLRSARRKIQLGATSIGVALTVVGCDPATSPRAKSSAGQSANKSAQWDKTAPVDQRVRVIVVEQLGLKSEPKLTDRFVEELGADSLDCVELVMAFEEEFNLEIPDEEAVKLKTLGDAITFVTKVHNP